MTPEELQKYKGTPFKKGINKQFLEKNTLLWNEKDVETFNSLIELCESLHFLKLEPTSKGSLSNKGDFKYCSRYVVNYSEKKQSCELIIASVKFGVYRFILGHVNDVEENKGTKAILEFYRMCDEEGIDLSEYALDTTKGYMVKQTIKKPRVEYLFSSRQWFSNVHHLDFNSSYFSRIVERKPKLKPVVEKIYALRHVDSQKYKDILNCTAGMMQSDYCPNYFDRHLEWKRRAPYQFAGLSRDAVNGNRELIDEYVKLLEDNGRTPILINTDGIWYQGEIYHDSREGEALGQWKHDYTNCSLVVRSAGCYQFCHDGKVYTRARGSYTLDRTLSRDNWKLGQILELETENVIQFKFNKESMRIEKVYG